MILKKSQAYESSGIIDPGTRLPIRTTARVRNAYRKSDPDKQVEWRDPSSGEPITGPQKGLPNFYASQIIETEFSSSSTQVPEGGHFDLDDGSIGEIRLMLSPVGQYFDVFISSIKDNSIDIISFQRGYYRKDPSTKLKRAASPSWYNKLMSPSWYKKSILPSWYR